MFVRLRRLHRTAPDRFRLTLDVVDPGRQPWEPGDCVLRVDLTDRPAHASRARGPLEPAMTLYELSPQDPPAGEESRLLWEIGRAVHRYVDRLFRAEVLCPFPAEPRDEIAERPDEPRP